MAGYERQLTASLRERGALDARDEVLAAWGGELVELQGWPAADEPELSGQRTAIFGITRHTGHVLTRLGLLSFELSELRGPHSPRPGRLRFSVGCRGRGPVDVLLAVDGSLAIAHRLREAISLADSEDDLATSAARRPPPKRRNDDAQTRDRSSA